MKLDLLATYVLWLLVAFGFLSVAKVSIENFQGVSCPSLLLVPVCYIVAMAYASMLGALIVNHNSCKHYFFCVGWVVAFAIALLASLAELFGDGGVCPSSSGGLRASSVEGVPLCYISLVILVCILVLFVKGPYQKVCDETNS